MTVKLLAVLLYFLSSSCVASSAAAPSAETRARTSLDVLADVVDPAYRLAMQGCIDRLDLTVREGERDAAAPAQVEADVAAITLRCDKVRAGFDRIRALHDAAIAAVEDGRFDDATAKLDQLRGAWRALQSGGAP